IGNPPLTAPYFLRSVPVPNQRFVALMQRSFPFVCAKGERLPRRESGGRRSAVKVTSNTFPWHKEPTNEEYDSCNRGAGVFRDVAAQPLSRSDCPRASVPRWPSVGNHLRESQAWRWTEVHELFGNGMENRTGSPEESRVDPELHGHRHRVAQSY